MHTTLCYKCKNEIAYNVPITITDPEQKERVDEAWEAHCSCGHVQATFSYKEDCDFARMLDGFFKELSNK
jgi:hypothetical protein